MYHLTERRHSKRYPMEVAMRVGADEGLTRDVSNRGVYFCAEVPLGEGAAVEMDLTLTNACVRGPVTLHVRGRVTRVDRLEEARGFAVAIEDWDITEAGRRGFVSA